MGTESLTQDIQWLDKGKYPCCLLLCNILIIHIFINQFIYVLINHPTCVEDFKPIQYAICVRVSNIYLSFLKDGLVRQSLTTQKADALLKSVAKNMCNLKYDLKVANHIITSLLNNVS